MSAAVAHICQKTKICGARLESSVAEIDFWQRRFWEHQIRDERDFERCVDYIHYNPVKHQLVKRVVHWPYSTIHRFASRGLYAENWSADPGTAIANGGE